MKRVSKILAATLAVVVCAVAAWVLRGVYDRMFMLEGVFLVTNAGGSDIHVGLTFPSGESREFQLGKGASRTFVLNDTGEGGIGVRVGDGPVITTGYVTSINDMCVIAVGDSTVSFSQLTPGMIER
ncbi:MAG: hypothetical protein R6V62_10665 [Candidatus Fermentibacteraceae bacterium]